MAGGRKTPISRVYCKYLTAIIVCFIVLIQFSSIVLAGRTTPMQAQRAVEGWLMLDPKPLGSGLGHEVEQVITYTDEYDEPIYYVVYLIPSGFVIPICP